MRKISRLRSGPLIVLPIAAALALGTYVFWEISRTLKAVRDNSLDPEAESTGSTNPAPENPGEDGEAPADIQPESGSLTQSQEPQPVSGTVFLNPESGRTAPLTVEVKSSDNYYIFLEKSASSEEPEPAETPASGDARRTNIGFYVSGDSTVTLDVPVGVYSLAYAVGKEWYGLAEKFGPNTRYYKAGEQLSFFIDGHYLHGNTIRLFPRPDGDPAFREIGVEEFGG